MTVTTTSVSSASRNNSSNDFSIFSCLNSSQRGGGSSFGKELGIYLEAWFFTNEKIYGFVEHRDKEAKRPSTSSEDGDAIALEDEESSWVGVGLRLVVGGDCIAAIEPALLMN